MSKTGSHPRVRILCRAVACAALAALGLACWSARAEDAPDLLQDPFYLALGSFILNTDTELRLDGDAGEVGTPIDWERDFGDDDLNRFRFDGYWRFGERHKLRGLVFSSSRDTSRTVRDDIQWGDVHFPAEANLSVEFKFTVYELAYEYAFMRRDTYEVAANFGLHYTEMEATIAGDLAIEGDEIVSGEFSESGDIGAPLPVIGLRGTWGLPHNFWIDASVQSFAASFDEYDGNLSDLRLMLTWQPKKWLGLGVGYNQFNVNVDVTKDRYSGSIDWTYKGPMIFYSASF
jgi:hypothetical protein